ncbi:MAG: GvpL/GvpF family gas vesicle protein [Myxococcaceae bacterium]|nr:GvpL/GvpF family gas vesicle protein [Myxococcaceae bacterium]
MLVVYALVDGLKAPPRVRALGKGPLRLVRAGGFTVLVSEVPEGTSLDAGLEALRRYDHIVRAAHRKAEALLPFRFGTTTDSVRTLASSLRPRGRALRQALRRVRGREQLTLRLIGSASQAPATTPREPRSSGAAFLRARAEAERRRRSVPELEPVRAMVADLIRAERAERTEGPGPVRATVFHLVDRGKGRAWLRRVKKAPGLEGDWRLFVSGPAPAWGFGPEEPL